MFLLAGGGYKKYNRIFEIQIQKTFKDGSEMKCFILLLLLVSVIYSKLILEYDIGAAYGLDSTSPTSMDRVALVQIQNGVQQGKAGEDLLIEISCIITSFRFLLSLRSHVFLWTRGRMEWCRCRDVFSQGSQQGTSGGSIYIRIVVLQWRRYIVLLIILLMMIFD